MLLKYLQGCAVVCGEQQGTITMLVLSPDTASLKFKSLLTLIRNRFFKGVPYFSINLLKAQNGVIETALEQIEKSNLILGQKPSDEDFGYPD